MPPNSGKSPQAGCSQGQCIPVDKAPKQAANNPIFHSRLVSHQPRHSQPLKPTNTGSTPRIEALKCPQNVPAQQHRAPQKLHEQHFIPTNSPQIWAGSIQGRQNFSSKLRLRGVCQGKRQSCRGGGIWECCSCPRGDTQQQLLLLNISHFQLLGEEPGGKSRQQELPAAPSPCKPRLTDQKIPMNTCMGSPTNHKPNWSPLAAGTK